MDLGSTIIGAIAIIICAFPFIMMSRSRKKREKKFLQSLLKITSQNDCQINRHEISDNFAIGMDEPKNFVFFYRQIKGQEVAHSIDLGEIQSCKVINTNRTIKRKEGDQKVIDRLELCFIPKVRDKPEVKLEFFNAELSPQLFGELQSVEKWSKLINDQLKQMQ